MMAQMNFFHTFRDDILKGLESLIKKGKLPEGATATDLVLVITQMLRKKGVVGKFVEFYGPGLANLPLADRATIATIDVTAANAPALTRKPTGGA